MKNSKVDVKNKTVAALRAGIFGSITTSPVFFATIVAFVSFFGVLLGSFSFSQSAYAATLSLSVSDNITTTVLPSSTSGTTATSSTTATNISVSTDNVTGYTLSLKHGSSTSAPALNGSGTSSGSSISSISSEKATLNDFTSGTWGYKPTKKNGSNWNNLVVKHGETNYTSGYYLPGPTTTADIIDVTDAANSTANEYNLALATKIDTSTKVGIYSNAFVVEAVANEIQGISVTYDPQGGNYSGSTDDNVMKYSQPEETVYPTVTVNGSTTTSTSASGTKKTSISDTSQYANSSSYYQDLTLDTQASGPYTLTIYYATESVKYDWICVFDGTSYTPSSGDGCTNSTALAPTSNTGGTTSGKKIGGPGSNKTAYAGTATYSVTSKTARIYFRSDSSSVSYGFWAEFTGGGTLITQDLISGTYLEPTKSGLTFAGWCDGTISNQNTTPTCSGTTYTASTVPGVNSIVNSNTTLKAMWRKEMTFDEAFASAGKSKTSGYYKMQDMTSSICSAVTTPTTTTENTTTQLIDTRDSKVYWISKLKDGNCWMTQNLDLDLNASTLPLTSTTSDVSADWNPGSTYYTKTATSSSSTATDMYSWDLGDYVYDGTTNSSCGTSATSYADCTSYGFSLATSLAADSTQRHYHVGNNYQWNAATAGTGGEITSGEATGSICPKGWRLPTSNTGGEFQVLSNTYGVTSGTGTSGTVQTLLNSPLYFVRGGYVFSGTLRYAGYYGYYWSSTPYSNSSYAYLLSFGDTSNVSPSTSNGRYRGFSVRCIAGS